MILKYDFKPLSFNRAYTVVRVGKRCSIIKTKKYREFEIAIREKRNDDFFSELEAFFDPAEHYLKVEIDVYLKNMMTKPKSKKDVSKMSLTAFDCGNGNKALIDALFKDTKINDAWIKRVNEEKHQSANGSDYFTVKISVHNIYS